MRNFSKAVYVYEISDGEKATWSFHYFFKYVNYNYGKKKQNRKKTSIKQTFQLQMKPV